MPSSRGSLLLSAGTVAGTNVWSTEMVSSTVSAVPSWPAGSLTRRSSRPAGRQPEAVDHRRPDPDLDLLGLGERRRPADRPGGTARRRASDSRNDSVASFLDHCHSSPVPSPPTSVSCQPSLKTTNRLSLCSRSSKLATSVRRAAPVSARSAAAVRRSTARTGPTSTRVSPHVRELRNEHRPRVLDRRARLPLPRRRRRLVIVGPHQLAVGVDEVDEHPVVLGEGRRVGRDDEAVRSSRRTADRRVGAARA